MVVSYNSDIGDNHCNIYSSHFMPPTVLGPSSFTLINGSHGVPSALREISWPTDRRLWSFNPSKVRSILWVAPNMWGSTTDTGIERYKRLTQPYTTDIDAALRGLLSSKHDACPEKVFIRGHSMTKRRSGRIPISRVPSRAPASRGFSLDLIP